MFEYLQMVNELASIWFSAMMSYQVWLDYETWVSKSPIELGVWWLSMHQVCRNNKIWLTK